MKSTSVIQRVRGAVLGVVAATVGAAALAAAVPAYAAPDVSGVACAEAAKAVGFGAGEDRVIAVAVSLAESNCDNAAVGGPNSDGSYDRGAWQINDVHELDQGRLTADIYFNAESGKAIFARSGWGNWTTFNTGKHHQFMETARAAVNQVGW